MIQRISTALQSVAADLVTESHPFGVAIRHVLPHNDMELLLQLHNFVHKLCARLEKYQKRGIVVEDAPTRRGFPIRSISLMDVFDPEDFFLRER